MADLKTSALVAALAAIQAEMDAASAASAVASVTAASATALTSSATSTSASSDTSAPVEEEASLSVTINNQALTATQLDDVSEIVVRQDVEAPSAFTIRFEGDDALTLADSGAYDPGMPVTVGLGYGSTTEVISGEITGLELEMSGGEVPRLVVRGYDRRHRLLRGTRTDSYANVTDSDIAGAIAKRNGLSLDSQSPTTITYELVIQHEQTDFEFLTDRAARIGYEVVIEDTTLYFRPHALSATGTVTLSADAELMDFYARLSTVSQPSEVHVRGWDPSQKAAIDGVAEPTDLTSMGGTTAADVASNAFSTISGTVTRVNQPVSSADEATAMAKGQLGDMALGFIQGEGTCVGNASVGAGTTLTLQNVGERFGGTYYVMSTEHTYTREQGYRTRFTARRSATNASSSSEGAPGA